MIFDFFSEIYTLNSNIDKIAKLFYYISVKRSATAVIYIIWYIMYKVLRIIFCLIAVAAAAVAVMIFIFFDLWGLIPLGVFLLSAAAMFICRNAQMRDELKKNPPAPSGDFITGRVADDDEKK